MYFNTDLCELFPNTFLRVPKSLKQLGLRTTSGCPWIPVDALTLSKMFHDSWRSVFMGPAPTDSTTMGGNSSEDSQLHVDLSPAVCSS